MMTDTVTHHKHTDLPTLNIEDPLRTRNDAAARGLFAACIAMEVSPSVLDSPTTMNRMGG